MLSSGKLSHSERATITEMLRSQAGYEELSASEIADIVEKLCNEPLPGSVAQTWVNPATRIRRRRFLSGWMEFEHPQLVLDVVEIARAKDSVPWWHRWMFNVSGVYVQRNLSSDTYEWAAGSETKTSLVFEGDEGQNSVEVRKYRRGLWEHHVSSMRAKADGIINAIQEQAPQAYWDALLR